MVELLRRLLPVIVLGTIIISFGTIFPKFKGIGRK